MIGINDRPKELLIKTDRDEGDQVRLTVKDAGIGLSNEDPDRLFEAFYTTKTGGMGVGLSVSRSIHVSLAKCAGLSWRIKRSCRRHDILVMIDKMLVTQRCPQHSGVPRTPFRLNPTMNVMV